jgi:hypothetical protein
MADGEVGKLLDQLARQLGLRVRRTRHRWRLVRPDGSKVKAWREDYPYSGKLRSKEYEV